MSAPPIRDARVRSARARAASGSSGRRRRPASTSASLLLLSGLALAWCAAPLAARPPAGEAAEAVPAGAPRSRSRLVWETLAKAAGHVVAGAFVAPSGDGFVLAGGAVEERDGRRVRSDLWWFGGDGWRPFGELPAPRADGLALPHDRGPLFVGGADGRRVHGSVWRLTRDALGDARFVALPELPAPSAWHAGGRIGDTLWVLAGASDVAGRDLHDALWSLDLAAVDEAGDVGDSARDGSAGAGWQVHPGCPGGPRVRAAAAVQTLGDGTPALFVFGGEHPGRGPLRDAWAWRPDRGRWVPCAPLPAPRAGADAAAEGQSHVLLLPGDPADGGPEPTLAYHTITDTWVELDDGPPRLVGARAVRQGERLLAVSGDGVRVARVERPASRFGGVDVAVLVAYLLGLVAIGVRFARRTKATGDYFVAGRRIPWWAAGLSLHGTQMSAITFLATPALAYATDLRYAPTWLAILIMAPIVTRVHLPFFRRLAVTTAYEYLERRFDYTVRLFGSLSFMVYQLARMAIVVYLPALALAALTGLEVSTCILLTGALATAYTVAGGMAAVIWTDVLQVFVLMGGVGLALALALADVGGVAGVRTLAEGHGVLRVWDGGFAWSESASWSLMLGAVFLQFGPYTTDQAYIQRYLTTPDERGAARGLLLNGWLSLPAALLFPTLGACLWAWYRSRPEALAVGMANDEIVPLFVGQRMPAGAAGLVIAGLFAATMSTLDSSMHSVATAASVDLHARLRPGLDDRARLRFARGLTVVAGVAGTLGALVLAQTDERSLFLVFQKAVGLLSSGVAGIFLLGIFTRRVGSGAALLGAACGTGVLMYVTWFSSMHTFWSAAVGIGSCVVTGLLAALVWRGRELPPGLVLADMPARDEARSNGARVHP